MECAIVYVPVDVFEEVPTFAPQAQILPPELLTLAAASTPGLSNTPVVFSTDL